MLLLLASLELTDLGYGDNMYFVGNCFCWALILKCIYGGELFTLGSEIGAKGQEVEHYMLRDKNGTIRHFKRVLNILPYPLHLYFFVGKIESSGKKRRRNKKS